MNDSRPGAGTAALSYAALLLGFFAIGFPAQARSIVGGLWTTEALAIALPGVAVLLWLGLRLGPYLGLRACSWKDLVLAAVVAALNQPVVSLLTFVAHESLPSGLVNAFDAKQQFLDRVFRGQALPMVITVAIAAPLGEELFFRGFALPAFARSFGITIAVLLSGALFSLMHLDPVGFIGLMEIGVMLALIRVATGSLWPAILAHAVNNGIAGGAFLLGYEDPQAPPPTWVLALGAVLLVAGIAAAVRVLRKPVTTIAIEEPRSGTRGIAVALSAIWLAASVYGATVLLDHR